MGKPLPRTRSNALEHGDPVVLVGTEGALERWAGAAGTRVPLRALIGIRDNTSFIGQAVADLVQLGLSAAAAEQAATAVLLEPTAAFYTPATGRIRQAVVVPFDADYLRVSVDGRLKRTGQLTSLEDLQVDATPFDLSDPREHARLAAELARDCLAFPAPRSTSARRFTVITLGNPARMGGTDTLGEWKDLAEALGRVLNVDLHVLVSQDAVRDAFPASTKVTLTFDPAFIGVAKQVGRVPAPEMIDCTNRTALELAGLVAERILVAHAALDEEAPAGPRALLEDEKVFHRKVGTSATFDHFGAPCKPCSHSLAQYRPYRSAPKAAKGMARLYSNFEPSMLYHCGRDNNCGVYAVFAPSRLPDDSRRDTQ